MDYNDVARLCELLSYRDKFRLAQLLVQLARKEEEEKNPDGRNPTTRDAETIEYVAQRLLKLRPGRRAALLNSIGAMFQFQGGISDSDREEILAELQRQRRLSIDSNGRVSYPR